MRGEIRRLLRETVASASYWSDEFLRDLFNHAMDLRFTEMAQSHEGWTKQAVQTDIIADQSEYTLPEGISRVVRVLRVFNPDGNNQLTVPLTRNERWYEGVSQSTGPVSLGTSALPTYRIVGSLLMLEPRPSQNEQNGLVIEYEAAPPRIDDDADKLPLSWPTDVLETLLIYDTWNMALGVEEAFSPNDQDGAAMGRLQRFHAVLESRWTDYVEERSFGPSFSHGFYLGD